MEGEGDRERGVGILLTVQTVLELGLHDIVLLTGASIGKGNQQSHHDGNGGKQQIYCHLLEQVNLFACVFK